MAANATAAAVAATPVKMRAKMYVTKVEKFATVDTIYMSPVGRSDAYPADGSDENNTYAKFSPSGDLRLSIANPALVGRFSPGDTFYVDFTPAPAK